MTTIDRRSGAASRGAGRIATWAALLSGITLVSGCPTKNPSSLTVPLQLRTTQMPNAMVSFAQSPGRVYVAPVQDGRTEKDRIGENRENTPPTPIYGDSSPTEFVRAGVIEQLKNDGVTIVQSADGADAVLAMTLNRFWAQESPNYDAQVILAVEVRGRGGAALWSGTASGHDGTFGRSLSAENYQQVLSNALANAVSGLVAKPQFQEALQPHAQAAHAPARAKKHQKP
jgi:hypothetical protein